MLIKGKWGVGKTSAMRSLLDEAKEKKGSESVLQIETASFVSLAGVNEINDERSLFLLGLDEAPEWLGDLLGGFSNVADSVGKGIGTAVNKAFNSIALVRLSSRMKGALVVIDEVERRGNGLDLKDVFGTVIRLVENRECKVVVIMNEEAVTTEQDKETLAWYREKIFDFEYEFRPTTSDAVAAVAKTEANRDLLMQVFEPLEIANLRVISQAARALGRFSEALSSAFGEGSSRIRENVCKIAALRLTSKVEIRTKDLETGFGIDFFRRKDREITPLQEKLVKLEFVPSEADEIILQYLSTGHLDQQALERAAETENSFARERRLLEIGRTLERRLLDTFGAIQPAQALQAHQELEECVGDCRQWAFAANVIWTLERIGILVDRPSLERKWAKTFPLPKHGLSDMHDQGLTDPEAIAEVRRRIRERTSPAPFEEYLLHLGSGNIETQIFKSPPWTDPEWLHRKLQEIDSQRAIPILQEVWQRCVHPGLRDELGPFREALDEALAALASENKISAGRVEFIKTGKWPPVTIR
jgi:hypothetical protein